MAMFVDYGAFFVGNLNPKEKKFETKLFASALKHGYDMFIEPCAGELAASHLALQCGFKNFQTSDVTLYSTVVGMYVDGKKEKDYAKLNVQAEGIGKLVDPVEILYYVLYFRLIKNEGKLYFDKYIRDLEERKEWHKTKIKETLDTMKEKFKGFKVNYEPLDMIEHLRRVKNNEKAIVALHFPTYTGGYEKHFDTAGKITWDEPDYIIFNPEVDIEKIKEDFKDAKCLVIFYEEALPEKSVFDAVYVRFGSRNGTNTYLTTNKPERVKELLKDKIAVRPGEKDFEPLQYHIAETDFEFKEDMKIEVVKIKPRTADYYRKLFTHNFVGSGNESGFAVIVDNKLIGIFGYSKTFATFFGDGSQDTIFLLYGMSANIKGYRPNRLLNMLATSKKYVNMISNDMEKVTFKELQTTMISKYPESKQMRGVMKLTNKVFDNATNMYKLTYKTELVNEKKEEVYKKWLSKEKAYKSLK